MKLIKYVLTKEDGLNEFIDSGCRKIDNNNSSTLKRDFVIKKL